MILKPVDKMTVEELSNRASGHLELAAMYREANMPQSFERFKALADIYRKELELRRNVNAAPNA